jgi:hypothetical protein
MKYLEELSVFPGLRTTVIVVVSDAAADYLDKFGRAGVKATESIDHARIGWFVDKKIPAVLRRSLQRLFVLAGGDHYPGWSWVSTGYGEWKFTQTVAESNLPPQRLFGGLSRFRPWGSGTSG